MRTFLQDAHSHLTIGTFVTTFTYALVVLQQFYLIHGGEQEVVSSVSVTVAFLLAVLSIGMFISYVDHIVHQARVTSIIDRIGNETRRTITEMYPPADEAPERVDGTLPDRLHDLLGKLGARPFPNGWHADDGGTPRLFVPQPTWDTYVALAFEEIRHHGAPSLQVVRRLRSLAENLLRELPEERHPPLHRQLRLLDAAVEQTFPSDVEREAATHADAQGIGSGPGFAATPGRTSGPGAGSEAETS